MRGPPLEVCLALAAITACSGGREGRTCTPYERFCVENAVHECGPDGSSSNRIRLCGVETTCFRGACVPTAIARDASAERADAARDAADSTVAEHPVPDDSPGSLDLADPRPDAAEDAAVVSADPDPGAGPETFGAEDSLDTRTDDFATDPADPGLDERVAFDSTPPGGDDARVDLGPAGCNNGRLDPGEACDGLDLGGKTCWSLGYADGPLSCKPDCTFDTLLCGVDSHRLVYEAVPNAWFKDDFVDVAWHPSGTYAILLNRTGAVVRFDPSAEGLQALSSVGSIAPVSPMRVAFSGTGDAFVVGYDPSGTGHIYRVPDGGTSLQELADAQKPARFVSIKFHPDGSYALIAAQSGTYSVNYVCTFDPATGAVSQPKPYNASAGVSDLAWVPSGILPAGVAALLVHGWNGRDAKLWYEVSQEIVPTPGNIASFGNMGRTGWRPGGRYALVSGTSSSVLYVFNGTWDKAYLSDIGSGVLEVAFRADGRRALVLGQPYGSPVVLHIVEHRPKGDSFSAADFIPQPIANWGESPFFADSNTRLLAAAFRPGVSCDEGLLVGQDPGLSYDPTFGIVVRFRDTDALDCP